LYALMDNHFKEPPPTNNQIAIAVAEATHEANGRIEELEADLLNQSDATAYWHRLATSIPHVLRILELERELEAERAETARWRQMYANKLREVNPGHM